MAVAVPVMLVGMHMRKLRPPHMDAEGVAYPEVCNNKVTKFTPFCVTVFFVKFRTLCFFLISSPPPLLNGNRCLESKF